ncbi:DUF799 domain-containing protein [Thiomicrorhabdus aquaedulcis]|uniref:DUF799 domain-containing protein n=1 Tax=Thiomicrorhabdus aquaedulcis TaxID=2211106 RepID=UPI000FD976F0|nr:DUF799 domain-containing protein [Thiomicrorhabdus aquaedulcis]
MHLKTLSSTILLTAFLTGCATQEVQPYDYTEYKKSNPTSILIMPPINDSVDVNASNSVLAQSTFPLAESGYYVLPVALTQETFQNNGLTEPQEIQSLPIQKLYEIFGADAGLYIKITDYGTKYIVISSQTIVTAEARLVDLKTGALLWQGKATASSQEQKGTNTSLVGMLVSAVVDQIVDTASERGHQIAGITTFRLLTAKPNGILHGPLSQLK